MQTGRSATRTSRTTGSRRREASPVRQDATERVIVSLGRRNRSLLESRNEDRTHGRRRDGPWNDCRVRHGEHGARHDLRPAVWRCLRGAAATVQCSIVTLTPATADKPRREAAAPRATRTSRRASLSEDSEGRSSRESVWGSPRAEAPRIILARPARLRAARLGALRPAPSRGLPAVAHVHWQK